MSDAGLDADLNLSIDAALAEVNRLQAELQAATENLVVTITADTSELPGELQAAIEGADTEADVTAEAGDVTAATEGAVEAADSEVDVTAEAGEVTSATEVAVESADTETDVTADAGSVTQSTETAVEAANTEADVTADAGAVTPAVESAVASADSHVEVTGDTSGLQSEIQAADDQANQLRDSADGVADSFNRIKQLAAVAVAVNEIKNAVLAAQEFNSAMTSAEVAIENTNQAAGVLSSDVERIADELQFEIGVDATEIVQAQSVLLTFDQISGDVFTRAIDVMADVSAFFGTDMVDASIRFGRALNSPAEGLTQLSQLGIRFSEETRNQIEVLTEAGETVEAQNLLLDALSRELDGIAAATADTTDKFAIAGNELRREFGAPLIEMVDDIGPRFTDTLLAFGPPLAELGSAGAPVLETLLELFISLQPAMGTTISLVAALAPLFEGLSSAVRGVPDELIQLVTVFAALRALSIGDHILGIGRAVGGAVGSVRTFARQAAEAQVATGTWRSAVPGLTSGIQGLVRSALSPANVAMVGLAVAFTLLARDQQQAAEQARQHEERVRTLAEEMRDADSVAEALANGLEALGESGDDAAEGMAAVGFTADESNQILRESADTSDAMANAVERVAADLGVTGSELDRFTNQLREGSSVGESWRAIGNNMSRELFEQGGVLRGTARDFRSYSEAVNEAASEEALRLRQSGDISQASLNRIQESENTANALEVEREAVVEAEKAAQSEARAKIEAGIASALWTQSAGESALASEDLVAALAELETEFGAIATASEVAEDIFGRFADASGRTAQENERFAFSLIGIDQALAGFDDSLTRTGFSMRELGATSGDAEEAALGVRSAFLQFALAADGAAIESEDMEAAAQALGVDMTDLEAFVTEAAASVNEFADAVISTIPTAVDILGEAEDGFDAEELRNDLQDGIEAMTNFQDNLVALEPFPALKAAAAQQGPEYTAELVKWLEEGNTGGARELDNLIGVHDGVFGQLDDDLRNVHGPELAESMGILAALMVEIFGDDYDLDGVIDEAMGSANAQMAADTPALRVASEVAGSEAANGFQSGYSVRESISEETADGIEQMHASTPALRVAAEVAGADAAGGFSSQFTMREGVSTATAEGVAQMHASTPALRVAAEVAGAQAANGFDSNLDLVTPTGDQNRGAVAQMHADTPALRVAAEAAGAQSVSGFDNSMSLMSPAAGGRLFDTERNMRGHGTNFNVIGSSLGNSTTSGLSSSSSGWSGVTTSAAQRAVDAVSGVSGFSGGSSVGGSIGDGMASGVKSKEGSVLGAVSSLVNKAIGAAAGILDIGSPSRVFLELGEDVGEGFAIGIANQETAVAAAAEQLAQAAIVEAPDIPVGEIDPQIAGLAGAGFATGGQTIVNVQPGAVVVQVAPGTRPDEARQLGREAGRGFEEALAEREIRVTARSA